MRNVEYIIKHIHHYACIIQHSSFIIVKSANKPRQHKADFWAETQTVTTRQKNVAQ
jgi:hypothetical protein